MIIIDPRTTFVRLAVTLVCIALLWPELDRYRAEWLLADANSRMQQILSGASRGDTRLAADRTLMHAQQAAQLLRGDPRAPLLESFALLLLKRGSDAIIVLDDAIIASGERPELTLNLGRARGISGDTDGANTAFLRTAWVSPAAIGTLPAAMRGPLLEKVQQLEIELRAGRLAQAPPL
ncbi:hypothetical protein ELE36_18925 [Pseudolysobacter antarcticus]|uniref:Uncharacterized protein n=1 Tax=Pseudolysobacter antarcticus TaxID=2511995 RepID=A0A411HP57_9GAMM|nr:hypothetical protein [Pseudolysobacter antarcticus]QBB72273.1 hypothetical protein ELE36_18925 [Pseudolysobacter antarcticus]